MFCNVINHHQLDNGPAYLGASTVFTACLASSSPLVDDVLVIDGSAHSNPSLESRLCELGVDYVHTGERLSFADGYNVGLSRSRSDWTILSASDVYPSLTIYASMASAIATIGSSAGCLIPLLSFSALPLQSELSRRFRLPVRVPLMTLNFNAFPTALIRSMGGVPTAFTGNYNDVLLSYLLKQRGKGIYLVDDQCIHYGSLTLSSGGSSVSQTSDIARFAKLYPHLALDGSFWELDMMQFVEDIRLRTLLGAVRWLPKRTRAPITIRLLVAAAERAIC